MFNCHHQARPCDARRIRGAIAAFAAALTASLPAQSPDPSPSVLRQVLRPMVRSTNLAIRVEIDARSDVATTTIRQTFRNTGARVGEADWILPLPADASADGFEMTAAGQSLKSEVLDAERARATYQKIVRQLRDPGLLEYFGQGCMRARVFPIPAGGQVDVEVRYRQLLRASGRQRRWTFPVRALAMSTRPETIALDASFTSFEHLVNVWSPTPRLMVTRGQDGSACVTLDEKQSYVPEHDPVVLYSHSKDRFGVDVVACPDGDGQGNGHFLLLMQPSLGRTNKLARTDRLVHFVLDTSGSMRGEKIEQAKRALKSFLRSLRPSDVFNVIPFSTESRPFFDEPRAATPENVEIATTRTEAIEARGGTNIHEALSVALAANSRVDRILVPVVVFLTDGRPTIGATQPERILAALKASAGDQRGQRRVFAFGVGPDVDTKLLDSIATRSGGERDYVAPGDDIEVATETLIEQIGDPVLFDCQLEIDGGITVQDLHPRRVPDLFRGSHLVVAGRYHTGPGQHPNVVVRLRGMSTEGAKEFVFEPALRVDPKEFSFAPTIWAQRRIGFLLEQIRLNGREGNQELIDEVERLGKKFGVVTPFTSHLILEDSLRIAQARGVEVPQSAEAFSDEFYSGSRSSGQVYRNRWYGGGSRPSPTGPTTPGPRGPTTLHGSDSQKVAEARDRAAKLGTESEQASGTEAVRSSLRLRALQQQSVGRRGRQGEDFRLEGVRRIGSRQFHLVRGVWVDRAYSEKMSGQEIKVVAFSEEWMKLLQQHPGLGPVFALSTRLVLVLDDRIYEIVDP